MKKKLAKTITAVILLTLTICTIASAAILRAHEQLVQDVVAIVVQPFGARQVTTLQHALIAVPPMNSFITIITITVSAMPVVSNKLFFCYLV